MEDEPRVIGLVADPGIAQALAQKSRAKLEEALNRQASGQHWSIAVDPFSLPLGESGQVMLSAHAEKLKRKFGWQHIIYLTDVPHYHDGRPVSTLVDPELGIATVVIPSLGIALPRNTTKVLLEVIEELAGSRTGPASDLARSLGVLQRKQTGSGAEQVDSVEGLGGRIILIVGMIRSNRPWKLVPRLSSALAGAAATGAFGVFYTSIWSMADYLSPLRLSLITLAGVLILSTWLLFHNRLWEKPRGSYRKERMVLYNLATVLTVSLAALAMYLLLFLALLVGGLVVIDQEYLSMQLDHEVGFGEYLNLAWLAASLGIMGGAIGSSFDDVEAVQRATFSQREYERRTMEFEVQEEETSGE